MCREFVVLLVFERRIIGCDSFLRPISRYLTKNVVDGTGIIKKAVQVGSKAFLRKEIAVSSSFIGRAKRTGFFGLRFPHMNLVTVTIGFASQKRETARLGLFFFG